MAGNRNQWITGKTIINKQAVVCQLSSVTFPRATKKILFIPPFLLTVCIYSKEYIEKFNEYGTAAKTIV
jgi:hypothetical protein